MNILSLFDGMSCGHLAKDEAGEPCDNSFWESDAQQAP